MILLSVRCSVLGRLFQMVGPQTEKARWPSCVRVRRTMAARDVVERRQRRPGLHNNNNNNNNNLECLKTFHAVIPNTEVKMVALTVCLGLCVPSGDPGMPVLVIPGGLIQNFTECFTMKSAVVTHLNQFPPIERTVEQRHCANKATQRCVSCSAKFPKVYTRTKRYCSFIDYALNNYQDKI